MCWCLWILGCYLLLQGRCIHTTEFSEKNEYKKRVEEQLKKTEQMVNESLAPETVNQSSDHHAAEHESTEYHSPEHASVETNHHPDQNTEITQSHEHEHRSHPPSAQS